MSLWPVPDNRKAGVAEVPGCYPAKHRPPTRSRDPAEVDSIDVGDVDRGPAPRIEPGETCMFRVCRVTRQAVVTAPKLPLMIARATGHVLLSGLALEGIAA